jgi:hypothetical protein
MDHEMDATIVTTNATTNFVPAWSRGSRVREEVDRRSVSSAQRCVEQHAEDGSHQSDHRQ